MGPGLHKDMEQQMDDLMAILELARHSGVSRHRIKYAAEEGRLPEGGQGRVIAGRRLWSPEEAEVVRQWFAVPRPRKEAACR